MSASVGFQSFDRNVDLEFGQVEAQSFVISGSNGLFLDDFPRPGVKEFDVVFARSFYAEG